MVVENPRKPSENTKKNTKKPPERLKVLTISHIRKPQAASVYCLQAASILSWSGCDSCSICSSYSLLSAICQDPLRLNTFFFSRGVLEFMEGFKDHFLTYSHMKDVFFCIFTNVSSLKRNRMMWQVLFLAPDRNFKLSLASMRSMLTIDPYTSLQTYLVCSISIAASVSIVGQVALGSEAWNSHTKRQA